MRHYIKIIAITLGLLGQGCRGADEQFETLLKYPDQFQGQEIVVTGVFHHQFEDVAIYLTNNSEEGQALWVDYSEAFVGLADRLDGKRVKVKGTFDKQANGHLGKYAGTIHSATLEVE